MLMLIMLIGVVPAVWYAIRRFRMKVLTSGRFPGVPVDTFTQWYALELRSVNIALWGSLAYILGGFLLFAAPNIPALDRVVEHAFPGGWLGLLGVWIGGYVVALAVATIFGTKANKLKEQYSIYPGSS